MSEPKKSLRIELEGCPVHKSAIRIKVNGTCLNRPCCDVAGPILQVSEIPASEIRKKAMQWLAAIL